jgi:methane monooxygenase PmoA-like
MEPKPDEPTDHHHHTGMFFAFGEVNGKDYWTSVPIDSKKVVAEAGPACVRIVAENAWGDDLVEFRDVRILNAGEDVIVDWTVTLTAANGPVVFAKDLKLAKEGAFGIRVAASLSSKTGDAPETISDAEGRKGEKDVRAGAAPWAHYSGDVDGKRIGIAVMNHPSSFRYPGDWHVRAYGLFAANPWILKGESSLAKGESITLRWRVYVHDGPLAEGKVADVFEGYARSTATVE